MPLYSDVLPEEALKLKHTLKMPEPQATTVSRPPLQRQQQSQISQFTPGYTSWMRKEDWSERIITFDASWFTVAMGTGR